MKKLILIALAFIGLQATAQELKQKHGGERKDRMEKMQDLTPEEMATLQTKKMTLHLDLTEAQQKQIQALNLEEATLRKAKMEEYKKLKESGEKPTKDMRVKMMNEKLDHEIELKQKMKTILNAEQFEKWEKSQAKRSKNFGERKAKMQQKHKY